MIICCTATNGSLAHRRREGDMELEINTAVNLADELERVACLLERESRSHSSAREPERAEARGKPGLIVWREVPGLKREVWEDLRKKASIYLKSAA